VPRSAAVYASISVFIEVNRVIAAAAADTDSAEQLRQDVFGAGRANFSIELISTLPGPRLAPIDARNV
jgi:hypothetical protein